MIVTAYLGLGSNLNNPINQLNLAIDAMIASSEIDFIQSSSLYRTTPYGHVVQPDFINAVAEVTTKLSPQLLLKYCKTLEVKFKRETLERWGSRTLDVDILWYNQQTINEDGLIVPH